jgi:glycosyltransferase involved in cell wall biosynthesis
LALVSSDVTVVIPVWDRYVEAFLQEAIESLLAQDPPPHLVVVDNHSRVPVPVREGVRLVQAPSRLTVGGARNLGLAAVGDPFVVFWDADDVMPPGALSAIRARFEGAPRAVAVAATILDQRGRPWGWPRPWSRRLAGWPRLFAAVHAVSSLFATTGATMIRTACARDAGGFADADGGDDWVLGVSLAFRGPIAFDDRPGRLYRRWPGSLSLAWRAVPDLVAHSANVRRRLRSDLGVPAWARAGTPLLAPAHLAVIFVLRPLRRAAGRLQRA